MYDILSGISNKLGEKKMELSTLELLRTTSVIGLLASGETALYQLRKAFYHQQNETVRGYIESPGFVRPICEYPYLI